MMRVKQLFLSLMVLVSSLSFSQKKTQHLKVNITIEESVKPNFKSKGRLLIYLTQKEGVEPKNSSIYNNNGVVFGKNIKGWDSSKILTVDGNQNWTKTADWDFNSVPQGVYYIQAVWDQNGNSESRINSPNNLFSKSKKLEITEDTEALVHLSEIIPKRSIIEHELADEFSFQSEILAQWWNKAMPIKASVLLPSGYFEETQQKYPIRYNVAGYGGRYTRINRLLKNDEFMSWWESNDAPQIITVFLDGEGPYGDSYQLNSENSGPYGDMLTEELIPNIETIYRTSGELNERFVDGCSQEAGYL